MAARPARPPSRPGVPGSGGARPADAGRATSSCTRLSAVSAAQSSRPDTGRGSAAPPDSGHCRSVRFRSHSGTARGPRCPRWAAAGCHGAAAHPQPAVQHSGSRRALCAAYSSTLANRDRPAQTADTGSPDTGTADTACEHRQSATARRCGHPPLRQGPCGHCGSGPAGQPAAEPSPPHAYPAGTAAALDLHSARERWRSGEGAPERRLALSGWLSYFPMKKSCSGVEVGGVWQRGRSGCRWSHPVITVMRCRL